MTKYLLFVLNLLVFFDISSKENWVWVLEANYSTFNERIDLYVDPSSMRGIGENLITYDEIFIPKKIVMYQGSLIGAMKNKMVANCENLKSKQIQIDLFSDFEATKLFDSAKEKDPNSPLYPTQNPDQRLKKYCQFLNEGSIRMKKDGNKTVFVNKQNENLSTELENEIQKPKTTLRSSEQNNKKNRITKTNNKNVKEDIPVAKVTPDNQKLKKEEPKKLKNNETNKNQSFSISKSKIIKVGLIFGLIFIILCFLFEGNQSLWTAFGYIIGMNTIVFLWINYFNEEYYVFLYWYLALGGLLHMLSGFKVHDGRSKLGKQSSPLMMGIAMFFLCFHSCFFADFLIVTGVGDSNYDTYFTELILFLNSEYIGLPL